MNNKLQYAVNEKPPIGITILQSFLHVITIYSGIIIGPRIIAESINAPREQLEYIVFAAIVVTAITTFIQAIRFGRIGAGYVLFTGTSASFLSCSLAAAKIGGFQLVATMAILAAPLEFLFAYFYGHFRKIASHVVGGVVIMLIAVNLIPLSLKLWVGFSDSIYYHSKENLMLGLLTFVVISGISIFGKPFLRLWGPFLGIAAGYIIAVIYGIVDLSPLKGISLIGIPKIIIPGFYFEFSFEFFSILAVFAIVTIVGAIETVGDAMAIQPVSNRKFTKIDYNSVQGALYSDGLGNILAGILGTVPNSTYSGNISIIELTGVASKTIGIVSALILLLFAFCPWLNFIVLAIPNSVLGAAMFIFFSLLFVTGLKLAFHSGINNRNAFIIGISFWIGFTAQHKLFFPEFIPSVLAGFLDNGIATGGITAFLISWIFVLLPGKTANISLQPAIEELNMLNDFIIDQKETFNLTGKSVFRLQLLCEEIFVYLINSINNESINNKKIKFNFTDAEDGLIIEIIDKSETENIDIVDLKVNPVQATSDDLNKLGLLLLNKLGEKVVHNRISNVNYISFKVSK